jgi:hypothetical protein
LGGFSGTLNPTSLTPNGSYHGLASDGSGMNAYVFCTNGQWYASFTMQPINQDGDYETEELTINMNCVNGTASGGVTDAPMYPNGTVDNADGSTVTMTFS